MKTGLGSLFKIFIRNLRGFEKIGSEVIQLCLMVRPSAGFVCLAGLALPAETRSLFRDGILGHQFDKKL
jgi:hypothetical protein